MGFGIIPSTYLYRHTPEGLPFFICSVQAAWYAVIVVGLLLSCRVVVVYLNHRRT